MAQNEEEDKFMPCASCEGLEVGLCESCHNNESLIKLLPILEARVQFLVDAWPAPLEDGGIRFPDGFFVRKN